MVGRRTSAAAEDPPDFAGSPEGHELRAAVADLSSTIEREASRRTLAGSDPRRELDSGFGAASELYRDLVAGAPAPETSSASASPSAEAPWRLGDFEILRRVGGGGMGDVYLARQVSLGREVALKLLSPHIAGDAKSTERFLREAKAAASTNHPSIVPVLQAGIEGGRPYIAMQYIHGVSLQELLEAGPLLDVKRALEIARDAVRATEAAHAAGVIHRDIKPGNVLLESDPSSVRRAGRVFLADFGLASLSDRGSITATGEILGTPAYMSPEQARGLPAVRSSDIYSLGATLYAMLAGRPPHEGSNHAAIIAGVAQREPVPIRKLRPSVDRDAATICEKAMRWEPDRRYATAGEMAEDIDRWLARKPIRARPASTAYRVRLWLRRNPRAMVAAVLIVVAVLAALAGERLLRRRGTLAAVDDLLRRGEAEEARERLETVPGIWPLRDSAVASLECRLFLQLGDLGRAAEAAARLAASKRAAEFAAIREIVDRQLAASESLILDGAWWAALEFVWETIGGIEVLSREAGGDPAWSDWIDSASVKALHVAASALIQAGEYELAVRIWEGDRARDRPVRIREVLTELVGVRAEGEPSLDEIGGFARRLTRCVTSVRFSRHARMVLESGGVQQGCTGARRKALLGLVERKALEH
ncbi:MAG: serine/threonine protein kinase, partial [Candidatus Eisenbacteria bacterium]|nr:serine/threonine protein kinase [Candidatus Eisenbacteria bacterium]